MHSLQTHISVHIIHMYISSCNENMEIEWAVWVLMDDIVVTMNWVDLTRPRYIYLINATSEVYPFAMSVLFNSKKGCDTNICCHSSYVILCTFVTECSLSNQRHRYNPWSWSLGISCSSTAGFTQSTPHNVLCFADSEVLQHVAGVSIATVSVLPLQWCGSMACLRCLHSYS
jgi:hypothetical protein